MKNLDKYLNRIQEREWSDPSPWGDQIDIDDIAKLLKFKGSQSDLDMLRHVIQPTLVQIMKNAGGDYRGRDSMDNTNKADFSGMEWIKKKLPSDWEEKLRKYIKQVAKDHKG